MKKSRQLWPSRAQLVTVLIAALFVLGFNLSAPNSALAVPTGNEGAVLFENNCAGCHLNGGNIIRRGKTLKLKALERNNVASVDAIARIAREGQGQMSGYSDALGEGGDQRVAEWIWQQAQNAWIQG